MSSTPFFTNFFSPDGNPDSELAYQKWRAWKLASTPNYLKAKPEDVFITIEDASAPTERELKLLLSACKKNSMALYRFSDPTQNNKKHIHQIASQLGLTNLDGNLCADEDKLTSITQATHNKQHNYIPYSNKRLSWHTDGYYNTPERQINGMLLHCASPAKEGGESMLLDHEIAYILLRDENPDWITSLMENDVLTIPSNILDGKIIREAQTGPVFSANENGQLHMRYSARKRNIEWKKNDHTLEAVEFLNKLWDENAANNSPFILNHKLQAGEGLICNNVLHCRTSFVDYDEPERKRLLYRGRYHDRVNEILEVSDKGTSN